MSMDANRGNPGTGGLEDYIERRHWRPIAWQALIQATILVVIASLLGMPVGAAMALIQTLTLFGALFSGILAQRMAEADQPVPAVALAQRSLASLAVSAAALVGMLFTFDPALYQAAQ